MPERVLTWIPRVIAVLYTAMIGMLALDVQDDSVWRAAVGLIIHLIPALVMVGCVVLAWKRPRQGGMVFLGIGILFTWFFGTYEDGVVFVILSVPLFLAGTLFIIDGARRVEAV
jgi:hypothetical protein